MNLLKKDYWWFWLILFIVTGGGSMIFLAAELNLLEKDAWYMNPKNWIIGALCLVFPAIIMALVFAVEMTCKVAAKLGVSGHELYLSPYVWLLLLIIPFVGWAFITILLIYLTIRILVSLYQGKGLTAK